METVPVTLGAVLSGITGAPPLFGNATGAGKTVGFSAGAFLQQLQNIIAESYGGEKSSTKPVASAVKQKEPPREEDKSPNLPVSVPVPVAVTQPAPPTAQPNPVSGKSSDENTAANIVVDPAQPVETVTQPQLSGMDLIAAVNPEINNLPKSAQPAVFIPSAPGPITKTAEDHTQAEKQDVSSPDLPAAADKKETPPEFIELGKPAPGHVPNDAPLVRATIHKPDPPGTEKIIHPAKGAHFAEVRGKTGKGHPSLKSETPIPEAPALNNFPAVAAPALSNEKYPDRHAKIPVPGNQSKIQSTVVSPPAEVVSGSKPGPKLSQEGNTKVGPQTPQLQNTQEPDSSQIAEPVVPLESAQLFKLVIGEALHSYPATHGTAPHSIENKVPDAVAASSLDARDSGAAPDAQLSAVKLPASIPVKPVKLDFKRGDIAVPGPHKIVVTDTKLLINDRPVGRDFEHEIKTGRVETKPDGPIQKANVPASDRDVVTAVPAHMPTHTALQAESTSGNDAGVPQQAVPIATPQAHTSPSITGKSESPVSSPPDLPVMQPLPNEKIQAARLVDRLGQAEMHLGMRTETFGSVQVHTVIRDSQVGLTIGSERGDLKTYLAAEVSGLESNLRQHDLHFNDVRFVTNSFSPGGYQQGGGGAQQQLFQQGRSFSHASTGFGLQSEETAEIEKMKDATVGLSVHA